MIRGMPGMEASSSAAGSPDVGWIMRRITAERVQAETMSRYDAAPREAAAAEGR
jgi:hypothetical protein